MSALDDAITQMISLGFKDPVAGTQALRRREGEAWAATVVDPWDVVAVRYRELLNEQRRRAQQKSDRLGVITDDERLAVKHVERSVWVDGHGWVAIGRMTVADHRAAAEHYRRLSAANAAKAERHDRYARLLADRGVATLNDLAPSEWEVAA